ncbi:MAG: DoxX-like family protein [Pirellulaceae bacterium]
MTQSGAESRSAETPESTTAIVWWRSPGALSRAGVAFVWLYHGLVPKLLFCHETELELVQAGPTPLDASTMVLLAGAAEVALGMLVLLTIGKRWPIALSLLGFSALLAGALVLAPATAIQAFNPVSLTVLAMLLCWINLNAVRLQTADRS